MARIILIVGGSRSGKSEYARRRGEMLPAPRMFLATCPPMDEEMRARIRAHQIARSTSEWDTVEEFADIISTVEKAAEQYRVVLVDCLTLWLSNLMHEAAALSKEVTEETISDLSRDLIDACAKLNGCVLFVANEVGMGIIPDNPAARRFRDLAGRCNQLVAAAADEVILMSCGIPLSLKGGNRGAA